MNRITISHQNDLEEDIDKSYCYKVVQAIKSFPTLYITESYNRDNKIYIFDMKWENNDNQFVLSKLVWLVYIY